MPAIRGSRELTDGFEVDSIEYGKRRIAFLELGGNDLRLTAYYNDVQAWTEDLSNPSLPTIYSKVRDALFPGAPISADGKVIEVNGTFYVAWHLKQRNPLAILLYCGDGPPPDGWWDNSGKPA